MTFTFLWQCSNALDISITSTCHHMTHYGIISSWNTTTQHATWWENMVLIDDQPNAGQSGIFLWYYHFFWRGDWEFIREGELLLSVPDRMVTRNGLEYILLVLESKYQGKGQVQVQVQLLLFTTVSNKYFTTYSKNNYFSSTNCQYLNEPNSLNSTLLKYWFNHDWWWFSEFRAQTSWILTPV